MVSRRSFLKVNGALAAAGVAGVGLSSRAAPAYAEPGTPSSTASLFQRGRLLPTFAEPSHLDVVDVDGLVGEDVTLLTTLQGIVNRTKPEIYIIYDPVDATWLDDLGVPVDHLDDPLSLIAAYKDRIKGAIVIDPEVPDTVNIATTLAGLEDCVVATAEQAEQHGLTIVQDLRGQFTGQDKVQIYRWQVENLWPRCDHRLLTGLPPTTVVDVEGVTWREVARETEPIRDSSNRDFHTFDLSEDLGAEYVYLRFQDAFGSDGWGPSVASVSALADGVEFASFEPDTPEEEDYLFDGLNSSIGGDSNRFCDGGGYFIYRFAAPEGTTKLEVTVDLWNQYLVTATDTSPTRVEPFPFFRDYVVATKAMLVWLDPNGAPGDLLAEIFDLTKSTTPYLGWFSNDVAGEWGGVDLAAAHSVEVFAADFYMNGTVLGGVKQPISSEVRPFTPKKIKNKVYVTMTVGEGDNIQYCQRHMRALWDHPRRGEAPTNWTISPILVDAGPAIYRYFQETATENDLLVCGPSGAGYTYGGSWPRGDFIDYAKVTGKYLRETGLDLVYAYNNRTDEGWLPFPKRILRAYEKYTPLKGIFQSWDGGGVLATGKLPVVGHWGAPGLAAEYKAEMDKYIADFDGSKPMFVSAGINAWYWDCDQIADLYALLVKDDRYLTVLGDEFFDTLKQAPAPREPVNENAQGRSTTPSVSPTRPDAP